MMVLKFYDLKLKMKLKKQFKKIRIYVICVLFEQNGFREEEEVEQILYYFRCKKLELNTLECEDLDVYFDRVRENLTEQISDFISKGSGWVCLDIISHEITFVKLKKIAKKAGNYIIPDTPLKKMLLGKNKISQVINPKISSNFCVLECIAIHENINEQERIAMTKTHPTPNAEFIEFWNFGNEIKIMVETLKNDLSFPMILNKSNLNKLKNRLNINKKINLIGYENGELFNLDRDKSSINEEFLKSVQYPVCWGTKHKECEEC